MAATVSAEDWREWSGLVAQLKLQPLVEEQDTRVINATDTMMDALSLLSTHNILSAPVYDSTTGGFVGLIDQLDLVAFLCRFSGSLSGTKRLEREQLNLQALKQQLESLSDDQRTQIRTAPVRGLIGLSERTTWEPVSVNTPPQTLVKMLADPNVHRLPVAAEDGDRFLGILTQLDVAKWLHQHVSAIPQPLRGRRVRDFVWPGSRKELATVPLHTTVIEVLLKIDEAKVSALPVVDAQGQLKGNISASDIAKLGLEPSDQPEQMLQKLFVPVSHFLSGPPVTCTMDSSVEDLLATFATHRVHRVWTVDNNSRPVGVVSLCDVFAQFVPQAETYIK